LSGFVGVARGPMSSAAPTSRPEKKGDAGGHARGKKYFLKKLLFVKNVFLFLFFSSKRQKQNW
jgi:hypothetical protein